MGLYLALIAANLIVGYSLNVNSNRRKRKYFCIFSAIILIFFAAMRDVSVGTDTSIFCSSYETIIQNDWAYYTVISDRYEFGFFALCKILGYISLSPQILVIFTSICIISAIYYLIYKNSEDPVLSIIIFIGFQYYASALNLMRQMLALAVLIIGYQKILKKRKYVLYVIFCLIASLFHKSAIIGVILVLPYIFNAKDIQGAILFFGLIFFLFLDSIFSFIANLVGYEQYLGSQFDTPNYFASVINFILFFAIYLFAIFNFKPSRRCRHDSKYEYKKGRGVVLLADQVDNSQLIAIMSIAIVFSFLSIRSIIFERVGLYFQVFIILLIPNIISTLCNSKRQFYKVLIITVAIAYCVIVLTFRPEWTNVVPYKFFWE